MTFHNFLYSHQLSKTSTLDLVIRASFDNHFSFDCKNNYFFFWEIFFKSYFTNIAPCVLPKGSSTGFISSSTKIQTRAVLGSMMPNWHYFSLIKLIKNWQILANNGFKLQNNLTSGMSLNFLDIGSLSFKIRFEKILFDSCFDDANRKSKSDWIIYN